MNIITGNTECNLLLDSGTGCRIIKLSLAKNIMFNFIQAKWSQKKKPLELKSFLTDTVEVLEILRTPIIFNDWQI